MAVNGGSMCNSFGMMPGVTRAAIVDCTLVLVVAILFFATLIRSAFGFGEALIAVPVLALIVPVEVAAPVAVLASITISIVVLAQDWRHVHFRSAKRLVFATLVGTPLGLVLLLVVSGQLIKAFLAVVIISFSAYALLGRAPAGLHDDRLAWPFGFGAGILGGAYGMNGPPVVIYGTLRRWTPQDFRATLQGYFLPASLMTAGGYWLSDLWSATVTQYYLFALPAVAIAIFAGRAVNQRLSSHSFTRYIHIGLILIGAILLLQAAA